MRTGQRILLIIGLITAAAMCAYPPWEAFNGRQVAALGHYFATNPPGRSVRIVVPQLLSQLGALGTVLLTGYLLLGMPRRGGRISHREMIASNALMAEHFLSTEKLGQWNPLSGAIAKEIIAVLRQVLGMDSYPFVEFIARFNRYSRFEQLSVCALALARLKHAPSIAGVAFYYTGNPLIGSSQRLDILAKVQDRLKTDYGEELKIVDRPPMRIVQSGVYLVDGEDETLEPTNKIAFKITGNLPGIRTENSEFISDDPLYTKALAVDATTAAEAWTGQKVVPMSFPFAMMVSRRSDSQILCFLAFEKGAGESIFKGLFLADGVHHNLGQYEGALTKEDFLDWANNSIGHYLNVTEAALEKQMMSG